MSNGHDLRNPLFRNWVRGAYALKYLKEGLKGFVDSVAKQHHRDCLNKIWKTSGSSNQGCNVCTVDNLLPDHPRRHCIQRFRSKCFCNTTTSQNLRRKCPNNFCSLLYDLIVLDHEERNPFWSNSNPEKWYTDHWEVAKCFLGITGYEDKNSAADTDATGLLCISINNIFIRDKIDDIANFIQAREVRNEIVHTGSYELVDDKLKKYIDVMVAVLKDKRILLCDEDAQKAVEMLIKLKDDQIHISSHDVDEMRSTALKAIVEKTSESLNELDKKKITIATDLENELRQKTEQSVQSIGLKGEQIENQMRNDADQIQRKITQKSQDAVVEGKVELLTEVKKDIASHVEQINKQLELKSAGILCSEKEKIVQEMKENIGREEILTTSRLNSNLDDKSKQCIAAIEKKADELNVNVNTVDELRSDVTNSATSLKQVRGILEMQSSKQIATEEKLQEVTENQNKLVRQTATEDKYSTANDSNNDCDMKRKLQDYLISRYRTYYIKTEVSPLLPEICVGVDDVFVPLMFKSADGQTNTSSTSTLFELLSAGGCSLRNIFLSGDSGVGKTTLCRRLLSCWCRAHEPSEGMSCDETNEEINAMKAYELLLFVSLRDVDTERSIEDMIESQLLINDTFRNYLSHMLQTTPETCLVILDGLDEWCPVTLPKHPCIDEGLPIQKGEYTTLFTSRPWKIEEIRPRLTGRDRDLEIIGLDNSASRELVANILKCFQENDRDLDLNSESYKAFLSELKKKNIQNLRSVPLMLILLLCLWVENKGLDDSKTRIYSSVLELLLLYAQKRYRNNSHFNSLVRRLKAVEQPAILIRKETLKKFDPLLQTLNKLAFDALFRADRKTALVFKQADLFEYGLSEDEIELCLRIGLLSQKKMSGVVGV